MMIKKHITIFPILALLSILISSCGQLDSFQSGRTLGKNNGELGAGLSGIGVNDPNANGGDLGSGVFPYASAWGQYGVSDRLDVGAKISSGANLQLLGKFQLIGTSESIFALSTGLGIEYQVAPPSAFVARAHIPLYLSLHPSEKFYVSMTPRYTYQFVLDDNASQFIGGSLGAGYNLGEQVILGPEFSYYRPFTTGNNNPETIFFFGVGFKYRLN